MSLNERDQKALLILIEQLHLDFDILACVLAMAAGRSEPVTRERVRQVTRAWAVQGLVHYRRLLHPGPAVVWATAKGLRVAGCPYRYRAPRLDQVRHTHQVARVRLSLERQFRIGQWESERAIHHRLGRARGNRHVPDGIWWIGGQSIAVEVELTTKGTRRLGEIIAELRATYNGVWYVAGTPAIAASIRRAAGNDPAVQVTNTGDQN